MTYKMPSATESSVHSPEGIQKLNDVIDSMTLARLRALLKDLSKKTPENFKYVRNELMLQPGALKRAWSEEREDEDGNCSSEVHRDSWRQLLRVFELW